MLNVGLQLVSSPSPSTWGKHCHQGFCICITFHSVINLCTQRHKSCLKGQATVWVNWRKPTWFWLMERICFIMFGCGFVSFISWSTVSAYLARAWQPLRDEVFSLGKWFLSAKHCPEISFAVSVETTTHLVCSILTLWWFYKGKKMLFPSVN